MGGGWCYPYLRVTFGWANPSSTPFGRAFPIWVQDPAWPCPPDGRLSEVRRGDGGRVPRRVPSVAEGGPADAAGPADEGDPREPRPGRPRRGDVPFQRARGGRDPMDPDSADARERGISEGPGGPHPDDNAGGRRRHVPR